MLMPEKKYARAKKREENIMQKNRALFIYVHNSVRSQMAEAWLNHLHGDRFEAYSAGYEPGNLVVMINI
jgi:hypothetical protein